MKGFADKIKALVADEEGASLVEYGLLVALIAAVCVVVITSLGQKVNQAFTDVDSAM